MAKIDILTIDDSNVLEFLADAMGSVDSNPHTAKRITFVDTETQRKVVIIGTGFTYDGSGNVTGGTVTQILLQEGGQSIAKASGFAVGAVALVDALTSLSPDDAIALLGNIRFTGNDGSDVGVTADGNDTLNGGLGNDLLIGGAGGDRLNGGDGDDAASYETATAGVHASLATPGTNTGDAAGDIYSSIEDLGGSRFADVLKGNKFDNVLDGGNGSDLLASGGGIDTIFGGAGADTIVSSADFDILGGGAGADRFTYETLGGFFDTDIILDWQGIDFIVVSAAAFGGGLVAGSPLTAEQFHVGGAPVGANGQFYYKAAVDSLFWDADGTGDGGAIMICHFDTNVLLHANDIIVV